jgi:hypothetical protein
MVMENGVVGACCVTCRVQGNLDGDVGLGIEAKVGRTLLTVRAIGRSE